MTVNDNISLLAPQNLLQRCSQRAKMLRIAQRIPQTELAERVGVAVGTIKRFEHTGEIQFRTLLDIALVLGKLDDFSEVFAPDEVPASLYQQKEVKVRQRARKK